MLTGTNGDIPRVPRRIRAAFRFLFFRFLNLGTGFLQPAKSVVKAGLPNRVPLALIGGSVFDGWSSTIQTAASRP
jgi:hypothetical protein